MNDLFEQFAFLAPDWKDLLEILVVGAVIYRILLVLAGTRAIQMLLGLLLLVGVYFLARILELGLIRYVLENLFGFGLIAALVVFQPELRAALAHLGRNRVLSLFVRLEDTEVAEEIADGVSELARAKIGAIIALEQGVGLDEYVQTGTPLQARVSASLLSTIFTPYSPLHDGAVLIRGDTIIAAGAILPLTQFPIADKSIGTRHRAALGLSEETDAVVIVVSEERATISVAKRGHLERGVDRDRLLTLLTGNERELAAVAR